MQITGSLLQDQMAQIKKNKSAKSAEFLRQLNLDPEKPIFLIGGCPNQFGSSTVYCEFDEMIEVSNALREALHPLATSFNILVRPHPNFSSSENCSHATSLGSLMNRHMSLFH